MAVYDWIYFAVLLISFFLGSESVSGIELKSDCDSYKVGDLFIKVKNGTKDWRRIERSPAMTYQPTEPVLEPRAFLGNNHNLNITWNTAVDQDGNLPEKYLLRLTKLRQLHKKSNEHIYLLLRLRHKTRPETKHIPVLNFPCVKLTREPKTLIKIEVWPLFAHKRSFKFRKIRSPSKKAPPRKARSVAGKTTCKNIQGLKQCSVEEIAFLSLERYIPSICHCAELPTVRLEQLTNGSLQVWIWNVPQYAYSIKVNIRSKELADEILFHTLLPGTIRVNENRTTVTNNSFGPGNYVASVKTNCAREGEDMLTVGTFCSLIDPAVSNIIEVAPMSVVPINLSMLGGIIAFVLATTALSCVIFFMMRYRRKNSSRNTVTELVPLNSPRSAQAFPSSSSDHQKNISNGLQRSLNKGEGKGAKMLLSHPDNDRHKDKVDELRKLLESRGMVFMDEGANWRDFAEAAGKEFTDIVVILSTELLDLCRAYESKLSDEWNNSEILRKQRQYEFIPCVVMKKLQTVIQDNPKSCPFRLFLISFENDSCLLEEFRNLYGYLKRTASCFNYNLQACDSHEEEKINEETLKRLTEDLKGR